MDLTLWRGTFADAAVNIDNWLCSGELYLSPPEASIDMCINILKCLAVQYFTYTLCVRNKEEKQTLYESVV